MEECQRKIGDSVTYCKDMYDATVDADALMLVTEWKEFRMPNWGVLSKLMNDQIIFDGRNIYDSDEIISKGYFYYKIG